MWNGYLLEGNANRVMLKNLILSFSKLINMYDVCKCNKHWALKGKLIFYSFFFHYNFTLTGFISHFLQVGTRPSLFRKKRF